MKLLRKDILNLERHTFPYLRGTDLTVSIDFFGKERIGDNPVPGPFAEKDLVQIRIYKFPQ